MNTVKVLLADDNEQLLLALRIQLEAHGLEVETCADSYMALARAQKSRPDVLILDVRMPAGDGFSVLERMGKIPEIHDIPVIFITGDKSPQLGLKAEQLGAFGLLHKPVSLSALLRMIDLATDDHNARSADGSAGNESNVFEIPDPTGTASFPGVRS